MRIGKLGTSDQLPTYQVQATLDPQYVDITNVYHWFKLDEIEKDYLYRRTNAMIFISESGGFNALSELDKAYAVKHFCVGSADRDTIATSAEQEQYWYHFVTNSEACRKNRWDRAKSFASFRLSIPDANDLALETSQLNEHYIKYGIEENSIDGHPGLIDWVNSTGSFTSNGFNTKSYYTDELRDGILDSLHGLCCE